VEVPSDDGRRIDDFIDDGIVIVPDINQNSKRAIEAMLLAIHILFRLADSQDKIVREDCLPLGKLREAGFLSETPVILGWQLNTRLLTIQLPSKKFKHWHRDLSKIIETKKASHTELEKLLGHLNHAATACPLMRYYLNRIRKIVVAWGSKHQVKKFQRYVPSPVLEDLKLWHRSFLPKIHKGLSLNLITYRRPSITCWSDACPKGMGGFASLGHAWQFQILQEK
jgi:hypothetical protein